MDTVLSRVLDVLEQWCWEQHDDLMQAAGWQVTHVDRWYRSYRHPEVLAAVRTSREQAAARTARELAAVRTSREQAAARTARELAAVRTSRERAAARRREDAGEKRVAAGTAA